MEFTKDDIQNMSHVKRLNIINSITGIKPANLIGTVSNDGYPNVAIFSSIVHLGSKPALIGFVMRPTGEIKRNTYDNIMENGYYTINHIHEDFIEQAHLTSAKFPKDISEFEKCCLTEEYLEDFKAPFVKESHIKIGMKFLQSVPIEANGTILMIGEIHRIILPEESMTEEGYIDLDQVNDVGISGLNSYYSLKKLGSFPYSRPF